MRLYPSVKVTGQSYEGVKRLTLPNQSLSLKEIVRRFVRRESLPLSKDGIYEERFGDLEKLSHADLTEKYERIDELKSQIAAFNKRTQEREVAAKAAVVVGSGGVASPTPVGEPLSKIPPTGGVTG